MKITILITIFSVLIPLVSYNQTFSIEAGHNLSNVATDNIDGINADFQKRNISISSNVGWFTGELNGFAFGSNLNYRNNILLLSSEYNYYYELQLFSQEDRLHMISIYGGPRLVGGAFMFDAQIGLGMIWSNVRVYEGYFENPVKVFVSRPTYNIKSGLKYAPTYRFAIGIQMHACFNELAGIYAIPLLSLEFGLTSL